MSAPRIAVVLPVHNCEKYLGEAVRSILDQTYRDFELVVVDDGSTDRSIAVLSGFSDPRMRVIRFAQHRGLVEALNFGIRETRSELIARMDADDVSMPRRFERQVSFLESHPQVALCGTWSRQFGNGGRRTQRPPPDAKRIRARLFFGWSMEHPSIMMRRAFLERHNLAYDDEFRHVEDLDFFIRAAELTQLANLPEVLLCTREHESNVSLVHRKEQIQTETHLLVRQMKSLIPDATEELTDLHARIVTETVERRELARVGSWLSRLDRVNRETARYDVRAFRDELCRKAYSLHARMIYGGLPVLKSYWDSPHAVSRGKRILGCLALSKRLMVARLACKPSAC